MKKIIAIGSVLVVVVLLTWYWKQQTSQEQPSIVTETVNCGKIYTVDVIIIGGVDVVKRIADLKLRKFSDNNDPSGDKCGFNFAGSKIAVAQKAGASENVYDIALYDKDDTQQIADPFNQAVNLFTISLNDNTIYFEDQFSGGMHELGIWK